MALVLNLCVNPGSLEEAYVDERFAIIASSTWIRWFNIWKRPVDALTGIQTSFDYISSSYDFFLEKNISKSV